MPPRAVYNALALVIAGLTHFTIGSLLRVGKGFFYRDITSQGSGHLLAYSCSNGLKLGDRSKLDAVMS